MASVFQRITGSNPEQCLVLDVNEALIYPFNVGRWTEIRISSFISFTSASDLNGTYTDEIVNQNNSLPRQNSFWGIKDSGNALPGTSGTNAVFVGYSNIGQSLGAWSELDVTVGDPQNVSLLPMGRNGAGTSQPMLSYGGVLNRNMGASTAAAIILQTQANSVNSSTSYASIASQRIVLMEGALGKTGVFFYYSTSQGRRDVPYSIEALRAFHTNGTAYTLLQSGYLTENFNVTGAQLPIPDSVFIYYPFVNNRIRIHNMVVEKFA